MRVKVGYIDQHTYIIMIIADSVRLKVNCFHQNTYINCAVFTHKTAGRENALSYDVAPGSEITQCNKIYKPLVVYKFTGNVMTSIITLCT